MRRFFLFLAFASVAHANFAEDAVPATPDILSHIIAGAERSGPPLCSHASKDEPTVYYLRSAQYLGECTAPFGAVHVARLFFIRSGVRGQASPPPRGHTFIVFFDSQFVARGRWEVDAPLERLSTDGSKLLLGDQVLFDYAALPASGTVVVDGIVQGIPRW